MLEENRAGTIPEIAKLDALYNGCTTTKSEEIKISVGFARFYLYTTSDNQRAAYLMNDEKNFIHLERWCPESNLTFLEIFVQESIVWKKINLNTIIVGKVINLFAENIELMDLVVNPTVKKVLMNFQELHAIMISAGDSDFMNKVLRNVLLEMFASKLGTSITIDMTETEIGEMDFKSVSVEMKAKVHKFIGAHCIKAYRSGADTNRRSPGVVTEALMHASATDEEKLEDARIKEALVGVRVAKFEGKRSVKPQAQETKKTDSEKSCEDAADVELTVGCIVITSANKDKARFDNFTAEVLRLGKTDKVRVKMLDGPAAGVAKDFPRCNLNLAVKEQAVPAEDEQETKRQKKAAELFGATL
jgi:hypothetical protein